MNFDFHDLFIVGLATVFGYYLGLFSRKVKLPSLIGYMFLGVLLGSSGFNVFHESSLDRFSFISEITLGYVAFNIGAELSLSSLKRMGWGIVSIIFAQSFLSFFLVLAAVYAVTRDFPMALIFGAMAPASAPAGTIYVIQENKASGSLTKAIYAVVGFDDGLAIVIFGFSAALANDILISEATGTGGDIASLLLQPVVEILLSIVVGGLTGFVFSFLVRGLSHHRDSIILVFGFVLLASGLSIALRLSLILTNMVIGFVFVNTRRSDIVQNVIKQVKLSTPFLYILFFCLAGAHMKLASLPSLGVVGILYIISRSAGKIFGSSLGGLIGNVDEKITKYIGIGILSQAGVAIGLSLIVRHEFMMIGSSHAEMIGTSVITTITATCIFFEIIGPILTKYVLEKAGEIPKN